MLPIPLYIKAAGVMELPPSYGWKPYQGTELIEKGPKNVAALATSLSLNSNFSLILGIAEWMMWRLDSSAIYPLLPQYVNALWARTVDKGYLRVNKMDTGEDTGDARTGPLRALQKALYPAFGKVVLNHPERGGATAGLVSLVRYTLPEPIRFDDWLKVTLSRFTEHFRIDPENRSGLLVPRAFLEPTTVLEPGAVPRLLDEQLSQIEWEGNPFLATPDQMRAAGFNGTPYRYMQ